MDEFMNSRKQLLLDNGSEISKIHLVIGNESCDLDSAVSAIVYAYLLQISKYASHPDVLVLPVLNTRRSQLKLKNEVIYWFQKTSRFNLESIVCKDEIDLTLWKQANKEVLLTLVDHNENVEYESIATLVEIIDHHVNSLNRTSIETEINSRVGSCCSLIAKRYLSFCEDHQLPIDEQIVLLLYGPILIDTICFLESAQRFNEIDVQMVEAVEHHLQSQQLTRQDVYKQLITAKNSIEGFTFQELIEKDLKVVPVLNEKQIALSSFSGVLVKDVLNQSKYKLQLPAVQAKSNYVALIMMGVDNSRQDRFEKDLAVYSNNSFLAKKIAKTLTEANQFELKLNQIANEDDHLILFEQKNIKASRKVVLPIIADLVSNDQFKSIAIEGSRNGFNKTSEQIQSINMNDRKTSATGTGDVKGKSFSKSGSPTKNGAAESINYYESYFEDSFVGEFSGSVNEEKLSSENIRELAWQDDDKINNTFEFGFDSFGPESILFQSATDNHDAGRGVPDKSVDSPEVQKQTQSEQKQTEQQQEQEEQGKQREKREQEEQDERSSVKSIDRQQSSAQTPVERKISSDSNPNNTINADLELVSLSVAEPQLKQKLDACFDQNKIVQSYDILSNKNQPPSILFDLGNNRLNSDEDDKESKRENVSDAVEDEETEEKDDVPTSLSSFKRNGTLTQSQRRQISPIFKFEEILNTSDDVILQETNTVASVTGTLNEEHSTSQIESQQSININNDESSVPRGEVILSRTGTLRKKIAANLKDVNFDAETSTEHEKGKHHIHFAVEPEITIQREVAQLEPTDDDYPDWRASCPIGINGEVKRIDMKVIEPYKKVLSHAGYCQTSNLCTPYYDDQSSAIITFSACYLPDRSRKDYEYVMEHLFMYVLTTLHELVADDYILVYFHNAGNSSTNGNNMPTFNWLKQCYYMIDRKLRKNLKALYLVHPTFWLKTLVIMTKPFINTKFSKKLKFINNLNELNNYVTIDVDLIPEPIRQTDTMFDKKNVRKSTRTNGLLN